MPVDFSDDFKGVLNNQHVSKMPSEFFLQDTDKRQEYTPGNQQSGEPQGQHKMFLCDLHAIVSFFEKFPNEKCIAVYAGAAVGTHMQYLAKIFPEVEWHLYDPCEFDHELQKYQNLKMYRQYFDDSTANQWKRKNDEKEFRMIFISDIRNENAHDANVIHKDMQDQQRWHMIMNSDYSIMKFRAPYSWNTQKFKYLKGMLLKVPHAPRNSTELRLEIWSGSKFMNEYEAKKIGEQMAYFNRHDRYNEGYEHNFKIALWERYNNLCKSRKLPPSNYPSVFTLDNIYHIHLNTDQTIIQHYKPFKTRFIQEFNSFFQTKKKLTDLEIDVQGLYSLSALHYSVPLFRESIQQYGIEPCAEMNILDGMAGVGGLSISMMLCFPNSHITSNELNSVRFTMLQKNMEICKQSVFKSANVEFSNEDVLKLISNGYQYHIIFLDPEWGGPCYHDKDQLTLFINNIRIEDCIKIAFDKSNFLQHVMIGIPKNFSIKQQEAIQKISKMTVNRIVTHKHVYDTLIVSRYP